MYENMTPEQWNQLIAILISCIGGLGVFMGLMGRAIYKYVQTRIDSYAKDQESEREKIRNDYNLKFIELEADTHREERLFSLVQAHANSYEIVANTSDNMGKILSNNTSQIEIFGTQLQSLQKSNTAVSGNVTDLIRVVNTALEKVNEHIAQIDAFFDDLKLRDEATLATNTQARKDILLAVKNLQSDIGILRNVKTDLDHIKGKVAHLVDTRPMPALDEDGNPTEASNSAQKGTDNDSTLDDNKKESA